MHHVCLYSELWSCFSLLFWSSAGKGSSKQAIPNATRSMGKETAGKLEGQMSPEVVETSLAEADDNVQVEDKSMVQVTTTKTVDVSDERVVRVTDLL